MKIDKNDAPKGAIAVDSTDTCNGCMYLAPIRFCNRPKDSSCFCAPECRRDGHDVIFKPRPAHKRDSHGRFTSAQSEARKQLIDKAQFPAYTESVKAMKEDETITQTLGKKQAEVERIKRIQTPANIPLEMSFIRWSVVCLRWSAISSGGAPILQAFLAGWLCRCIGTTVPEDVGQWRDSFRVGWREADQQIAITKPESEAL